METNSPPSLAYLRELLAVLRDGGVTGGFECDSFRLWMTGDPPQAPAAKAPGFNVTSVAPQGTPPREPEPEDEPEVHTIHERLLKRLPKFPQYSEE